MDSAFLAEEQPKAFCLCHSNESASFIYCKQFIVHLQLFLFSPLTGELTLHKSQQDGGFAQQCAVLGAARRICESTLRCDIQREQPVSSLKSTLVCQDPVRSGPSTNTPWRTAARPHLLNPSCRPTAPSSVA